MGKMSSAAKRPILRTLSPVVGSSRESIFISCRIRPSTRLCTTPGGRFYTNTHCSGSAANTKLEAKRSIPLTTCQHPVVKGSHEHEHEHIDHESTCVQRRRPVCPGRSTDPTGSRTDGCCSKSFVYDNLRHGPAYCEGRCADLHARSNFGS